MNEVLHANIFFFIASIAAVVFTILLCTALYHMIKIIRSLRNIIERIEHGSEVISEDIAHFRKFFAGGSFISHVINVAMSMRGKVTRSRRRKNHETDITSEDEE